MAAMTQWTVYTHAECSLCEQLLDELAALLGPAAGQSITVIDIAHDAALESRYGRRVPVLLADGDFVCEYRLDRDRVGRYLTA
jgi:hypothetical protein